MFNKQNMTLGGVILAIILGVLALVGGNNQSAVPVSLGAEGTRFPNGVSVGTSVSPTSDGFLVGTSGTNITRMNAGTCYLQPNATTIAASTTAVVECQGTAAIKNPNTTNTSALTGVSSGDFVSVMLSTTTAGSTIEGLDIIGASASTTQGYITLRMVNQTGTTFTWPTTGSASGTASYISFK